MSSVITYNCETRPTEEFFLRRTSLWDKMYLRIYSLNYFNFSSFSCFYDLDKLLGQNFYFIEKRNSYTLPYAIIKHLILPADLHY